MCRSLNNIYVVCSALLMNYLAGQSRGLPSCPPCAVSLLCHSPHLSIIRSLCSLSPGSDQRQSLSTMSVRGPLSKMDTDSIDQLEDEFNMLAAAGRALIAHCRRMPQDATTGGSLRIPKRPITPVGGALDDVHESRRSILSHLSRIQALLEEPADFLQQLANQVRIPLPLKIISYDPSNPFSPLLATSRILRRDGVLIRFAVNMYSPSCSLCSPCLPTFFKPSTTNACRALS